MTASPSSHLLCATRLQPVLLPTYFVRPDDSQSFFPLTLCDQITTSPSSHLLCATRWQPVLLPTYFVRPDDSQSFFPLTLCDQMITSPSSHLLCATRWQPVLLPPYFVRPDDNQSFFPLTLCNQMTTSPSSHLLCVTRWHQSFFPLTLCDQMTASPSSHLLCVTRWQPILLPAYFFQQNHWLLCSRCNFCPFHRKWGSRWYRDLAFVRTKEQGNKAKLWDLRPLAVKVATKYHISVVFSIKLLLKLIWLKVSSAFNLGQRQQWNFPSLSCGAWHQHLSGNFQQCS